MVSGYEYFTQPFAKLVFAKLAVFDLETKKMAAVHSVGADPDVLAFDKGLAPQ